MPASYRGGQVHCQESDRGIGFYPNSSVFPCLRHCMDAPYSLVYHHGDVKWVHQRLKFCRDLVSP